jgi:hypothetical protein
MNSLQQRWKRFISSFRAKPRPALSIGEGEIAIVTYTSTVDKMKIFSAFVREGLEDGDLVAYTYPDEESEPVRTKLKEHGIDVEKYERQGALLLRSLTEYYIPDGKFDKERAIRKGLDDRAMAKRKGYKHLRELEDLGDFSFLNGRWQTYIEYWNEPRWWTPLDSNIDILSYTSFMIKLTAFNVEGMDDKQLAEILKAFWVGNPSYTLFIDLLEHTNAFSNILGMPHKKLVGRKILLEFDPASDEGKVIDSLAKEAIANVEPIFIFTSEGSSTYSRLTKHQAVKFFLLSSSISIPKSMLKNEILLPAKNTALILDSLNKVLEQHAHTSIVLVFDKLSELITLVGFDRAYKFLLYVLEMLPSRTTALFLLNASAHEAEVVSRIRGVFHNILTYDKDGLKTVKIT